MSAGTLQKVWSALGCVWWDLELGKAVASDLREGRRSDDAAPDRQTRLVDRHEDDQPWILRRHDAYE
jgi:hypothetical protein